MTSTTLDHKILDTIGDTVVISMKKQSYLMHFGETWTDVVTSEKGIPASVFLAELHS